MASNSLEAGRHSDKCLALYFGCGFEFGFEFELQVWIWVLSFEFEFGFAFAPRVFAHQLTLN